MRAQRCGIALAAWIETTRQDHDKRLVTGPPKGPCRCSRGARAYLPATACESGLPPVGPGEPSPPSASRESPPSGAGWRARLALRRCQAAGYGRSPPARRAAASAQTARSSAVLNRPALPATPPNAAAIGSCTAPPGCCPAHFRNPESLPVAPSSPYAAAQFSLCRPQKS